MKNLILILAMVGTWGLQSAYADTDQTRESQKINDAKVIEVEQKEILKKILNKKGFTCDSIVNYAYNISGTKFFVSCNEAVFLYRVRLRGKRVYITEE